MWTKKREYEDRKRRKQTTNEKKHDEVLGNRKSYAMVVRDKKMNGMKVLNGTEAIIHIEKKEWLHQSLMGTLKDLTMFEKLKNLRLLEERGNISLNYLGDDLVLIRGLGLDKAQQTLVLEIEGIFSLFHSILPWNQSLTSSNRLAWVTCYGVPLEFWGRAMFWVLS